MDKPSRQNRVREALGRLYDQQPPYFREYLRRYQEDPASRVFAPLAEAYRRMGRVDEALEICREGLEHHPDFHGGRVALAKCLVDKKLFDEARGQLERVVRAVPENLLAQRLLGEVCLALEDRETALHAFKMALLLSPADVGLAEKVHRLERSPSTKATSAAPEPEPSVGEDLWQAQEPASAQTPLRAEPDGDLNELGETSLTFVAPSAPAPVDLPEQEGPPSDIDTLLAEADEPSLWALDEKTRATGLPSVGGIGHDDMFVAEPLDAEGESLQGESSDGSPPAVELAEEPEVIRDEGLDALLGAADGGEEAFRVEHVSDVFRESEGGRGEITTETLGDLYFSQGQFDKALRIFEKVSPGRVNAELARKIQACKQKLGVSREQLLRARQVAALKQVLHRVKGKGGLDGP